MKVILREDIKGQGKKGDVVNVAEGYARNFLLPRNLAVEASESKLKEISVQKKGQERKKKIEEEVARKTALQLEGVRVEITAKVGESGRLFGAVSNIDISENLFQQHGIKVDKKKIVLKEPIKTLGEFPVSVRLHPAVQASITIVVRGA